MDAPDPQLGTALLVRARNAIGGALGARAETEVDHPRLQQPGATFVTLTRDGALRGCIGSLEAWRPLDEDIRANAMAAAFRDPRFPPVDGAQWPHIRVEASLLTPAIPMSVRDEADALAQLVPGRDGVIFQCGGRRSTFLPQVWEQLPDPASFLTRLKEKAGLPGDFWSAEVSLARYRVEKWREQA